MTCGCSNSIDIIRGNAVALQISLKADGIPVADLASMTAARFVAIDGDGDLIIDKSLPDMLIDQPVEGTVTIPLSSVDIDISERRYDIAFQGTWGPADNLEWNFPSVLNILKGIIP